MSAIRSFLTDSRTLSFIGIAALTAFFFLGANTLKVAVTWAIVASGVILVTWIAVWAWRRRQAGVASDALEHMLERQATHRPDSSNHSKTEIDALRKRMTEAVRTIKTSRLGQVSGRSALYELPWYITIGNPAAGKSTAVVNSGLKFPFADGAGSVIKGIGGTRNCDWFFTSEGILLDTAGRYSVHEEDRSEWLGFLDLLKKNRPRAPINGIIVTVSIGELIGNPPSFAIALAKNLRQRVQELTERLEVFAPVYVMFSKADLIHGFNEFFQDVDWNERDRVWGATLPDETGARQDAIEQFDRRFDELYEGLREVSVAQMSIARGERMPPGLLTFPLEFAAIKPALRSFLATLFEDNPFQFKPIFRGFYITSAIQSGETRSASSERVEKRFGLAGDGPSIARISSSNGFFLKDLFSKVIFADKNLVRHYANRQKQRIRYAAFLASITLLGLALGGWSWSYANNRTLTENIRADLDKAIRVQEGRIDLQSRLEALEILQDRIRQLEQFDANRPLSLSLGLFQGDELKTKLLSEYYKGISEVMLKPVADSLEAFLAEVNRQADQLSPIDTAASSVATTKPARKPYQDASPTNVEDAYNALKTYLMLGSREHTEVGHLSDQIARFWRSWLEANRGTMSREQMIASAERVLSFHLQHADDPAWPVIANNLSVIDQARDNLKHVVRGMPALERVYAEIKARASTRFPPVTVATVVGPENAELVVGSRVISGTFTVEAWRGYIQSAVRDAATNELQRTDWVLKTSTRDDLSLAGSPEQIQKTLVGLYKKEYADEWKQFVMGVSVSAFDDFPGAIAAMNRLGDPQSSPIGKLMQTLFEQTSWDNPTMANVGAERAQKGFIEWFKNSILRMSPARVEVDVHVNANRLEVPMGPIGQEFAGVARLLAPRDGAETILNTYLKQLSGIRTRLNLLKNQGDPGPGAIKLLTETIEGGNSELADTLRFVDEQMLNAIPDAQRMVIRPLLVRPLLQTFAAVVKPGERELNKIWLAHVYDPFRTKLAGKYPFSPAANLEATPAEIAQIFGPGGVIAKYAETSMGALIVRRGDHIAARTWGDLGVHIRPDFIAGLPQWVGSLEGGAASGGTGTAPATQAQTTFRLLPLPSPGTTEYTIEIDGQKLRYRNGAAQWATFVWPNPAGAPGARIIATAFDGREIEIASFSGRFGLEKLINSAERMRRPDGSFQLSWQAENITVPLGIQIISSPQAHTVADTAKTKGLDGITLPASVAGETVEEQQAPPLASSGMVVAGSTNGRVAHQ
ncbi:type VI secretion system membrane subunit TssM [Aromatoleum diolicum]|uniref:Type VI secretion system membrane subunit TssM n=1 Tax=Aromatoleum diolicum TaxID=75796 RepID=A0ABX1QH26_9RHOO|nr:type VI secretion system membrane subunit TssM [Aromatoleum diolicum]NMG76330.1 type VI secretion system membrane subunit TssM [Aromatoleum diolicum]